MNQLTNKIQYTLETISQNLYVLRLTSKQETKLLCLSNIGELLEDTSKAIQEYLKFGEE